MKLNLPQGGLVLGMGVDMVDVARVESACKRHGERFLKRVFTDEERGYCHAMKNPWPHFAVRFAAKEAASKAFGTGITGAFGWTTLSVRKGKREEPLAELDAAGQALLQAAGATDILLSLSHTANLAIAVALLIRGDS